MERIEVLTGPERRRRWSEEEKRSLLASAFAPGANVSDVARRAGLFPGQLYRWRQEFRVKSIGFAEVVVSPLDPGPTNQTEAMLEVEFVGGVRLRIAGSVNPDLAVAIVNSLAKR
jgi:transposase